MMTPMPNVPANSSTSPLDARGVSPLGQALREDAAGELRDEIVALFDALLAQASHAMRRPQSRSQFEANGALMEAAGLARRIVDDYWMWHHAGRR